MTLFERHENVMDKCVQSLNIWKQLIIANLDDEAENEMAVNTLKSTVKEYCELKTMFETAKEALKNLEEKLDSNEPVEAEDIEKLYEESFNSVPTSSKDYRRSDIWQNIFGTEDVMEVIKKKSKIDDTEYEELGDSLLCSNVFTPPIDPISKTVIRNPYKNVRCKHVYENSTIVSYIKQLKNKAKCPYIGCNNNQLRMSDLIEDKNLREQVTEYLETQQNEDSDD